MNYYNKYETYTIKTEIYGQEYFEMHDAQVEKYTNDGWQLFSTTIGYIDGVVTKITELRKYCNYGTYDIKSKIKELINKYKWCAERSSNSYVYEKFIEDLEELVR